MIGGPHDPKLTEMLGSLIHALLVSLFTKRKAIPFIAKENKEDLRFLGELIADGKLTPVIDRRYSLSEGVDAFRYVEDGHARGKVLITVG